MVECYNYFHKTIKVNSPNLLYRKAVLKRAIARFFFLLTYDSRRELL